MPLTPGLSASRFDNLPGGAYTGSMSTDTPAREQFVAIAKVTVAIEQARKIGLTLDDMIELIEELRATDARVALHSALG